MMNHSRIIVLILIIFIAYTPHGWAASPEDVIISELMWMGDFAATDNEWIELRNMTAEPINLAGWSMTRFTGARETFMLRIAGGTLPVGGFRLIARNPADRSNISVDPDTVDRRLLLDDETLQIKLYDGTWDAGGNLIDVAGDRGTPLAGDADNRKSMVRKDPVTAGQVASSWQTADTAVGWDEGTSECGTPTSSTISLSPELGVFPATLDFQLPQESQKITVSNRTAGQLQWGVFDVPAWLMVTPVIGVVSRSTPAEVNVTVLTENLLPQTHQGSFPVRNLTDLNQTVEVLVSVNRLPIVVRLGDQIGFAGEPMNLVIGATDPDGDTLTFRAEPLPVGAALDDETGVFTWTPTNSSQDASLEFQVDDGNGGVVSQSVTIQVIAPPPYLVKLELLSEATQSTDNLSEVVAYQFRVENQGTIPDEIQLSAVARGDNPPSAITLELQPSTLTLPPKEQGIATLSVLGNKQVLIGEYRFLVTATSQGDTSQQQTISVAAVVLERPALEIDPIFDDEQTRYTFHLQNPTSVSLNWGLRSPSWLQISPAGGSIPAQSTEQVEVVIQFTDLPPRTHEGVLELQFSAGDGTTALDTQRISVRANRRPLITAPLTLSHTTDVPLEISIEVSDPDQDGVTLSAMGLPAGAFLTQTQVEPGMQMPLITFLRWDAPVEGNHTIFLQATDLPDPFQEIDLPGATVQQTIELEIILKTRWIVVLHPRRPNLIHIPVSDPRFLTVSPLFDHLGSSVEQIVTYDSVNQTFRAYTDLSVPGRADDLPLRPYTGLIVFLKADSPIQEVTFEGIPYTDTAVPIVGRESNGSGVNLMGLPVNDPRLETLGDLKAHYPQITEIIGQNAAGELVSTELMDVPIVGGQAFVVFSEVSVQLDLTGTPWTQNE